MGIDQTMSDFDQMQYQARVANELAHIIQTQKIPNALLFSGPESTGKKQAAFLFAKGANCFNHRDLGCTSSAPCISCSKIDARTHPDILTIDLEKDKKIISIAQIRQITSLLNSRPNEASHRMVLILHADHMNTQAQNALLKMLEEPPENSFFILLAVEASKLLATIHSRCRKIRFKPLSDAVIENYLNENLHIDKTLSHIASRTAGSNLELALRYCGARDETAEGRWSEKRQWLLTTLIDIIQSGRTKAISTGLLLSAHLSRHPDSTADYLAIIKTFLRDLMVCRFYPQKIVNLDFSDTFSDITHKISQTVFLKWMSALIEAEKKIASNSSPRLTLDCFFLEIAAGKGSYIYD